MEGLKTQSRIAWPHAPTHNLSESGVFMVTAGTYQKQPLFRESVTLNLLLDALLQATQERDWRLEAWSVFPNHYHFIAQSSVNAQELTAIIRKLHSCTAIELNKLENKPGRKVWHNFWETRLTNERSYLARLNYVHSNAVKHGIVSKGSEYPWCSAAWFERTASRAQIKTVYGMKVDRLNVDDDF